MKLVTAVVNSKDSQKLVDAIVQRGLMVTKLGSKGGFLRQGNVTLLIGVEDEQVEDVVALIREMCRARNEVVMPPPPPPMMAPSPGFILEPVEVRVGGAVIFVQSVERFEKT